MASLSASLNYSAPLTPGGAIDNWTIDAVSRPPDTVWNFRQLGVETPIVDLREARVQPRLDDAGFERVVAPTAVDHHALEVADAAALAAYQAETEALLRSTTHADAVVFFDATWRHADTMSHLPPPMRSPHQRVHVDQNPRSARARAVNHGGADRPYRRFQIINVWRPLLGLVRNYPLAFCDYRSLDLAADLVPTRLDFPAWLKDRENYSVQHNAAHRWYYWSAQSPDEALLFKCYDSASRGLARVSTDPIDRERGDVIDVAGLCPHSAVFDRGGPTSGRLRVSLELRALVFYD